MFDKVFNMATYDRIFVAANVELVAQEENPDKMLCRFEFYEILARIAQVKYKDTKVCDSFSSAFNKIVE